MREELYCFDHGRSIFLVQRIPLTHMKNTLGCLLLL